MTEEIKNNEGMNEENQENIEEMEAAESQAETAQDIDDDSNFIDRELETYRAYLDRSWEAAFKRYGWVLFHSLTPEEKVKIMNELGFEPIDARDFYNLACLAIEQEDYKMAEKHLDKALDLDPEHAQSLFNMALLLEKTDRKIQAIEYWEQYLEQTDDEEEIIQIAEHLEQSVN